MDRVSLWLLFLLLSLFVTIVHSSTDYYTPNGEISQIISSTKLVERSPSVIGWVDAGKHIVMLRVARRDSLLMNPANSAIANICDGAHALMVGYEPDFRSILREMNSVVVNHWHSYNEDPSPMKIRLHLSRWLTKRMYNQRKDEDGDLIPGRPMAAYTLLACANHDNDNDAVYSGPNSIKDQLSLMCVRNDGTCCDCQFIALGQIGNEPAALLRNLKPTLIDTSRPIAERVVIAAKALVDNLGDESSAYLIDSSIFASNNNNSRSNVKSFLCSGCTSIEEFQKLVGAKSLDVS